MVSAILQVPIAHHKNRSRSYDWRGMAYTRRHNNVRLATVLVNYFVQSRGGEDPTAFEFEETLKFLRNRGAVLLQFSNLVPSVLLDSLFQLRENNVYAKADQT